MPATAYKEEIDPRRWFVERIRAQAKEEGVEFSQLEQEYLFNTERGDDAAALAIVERIKGKQHEQFDERISGLAWRRYQADIVSDPEVQEEYKKALHALANVDEYPNLSMFICCIGLEKPPEELNAKSSPWRTLLVFALIVLAFIIAALLRR